jgi:hypothetical protein
VEQVVTIIVTMHYYHCTWVQNCISRQGGSAWQIKCHVAHDTMHRPTRSGALDTHERYGHYRHQ